MLLDDPLLIRFPPDPLPEPDFEPLFIDLTSLKV